jgi:hypothetical protein
LSFKLQCLHAAADALASHAKPAQSVPPLPGPLRQ